MVASGGWITLNGEMRFCSVRERERKRERELKRKHEIEKSLS